MTDPFHDLAALADGVPPTPRAAFADELKQRVAEGLGLNTPNPAAHPVNAGSVFYFTLPAPDPERAERFYRELFGWDLEWSGQGYHAKDVYPPMGLASNQSEHPEVWIEVADVHAAVAQVRSLGGAAEDPVFNDSGWSAACQDNQGVAFNLAVGREDYRQPARRSTEPGELFYLSVPSPDAATGKSFYRELLGWQFGEPGSEGGMHVENVLPDCGLGGGRAGTHPEVFFRVADLDAAMASVQRLGGTAEFAGEGEEGRHAMCTDDQGVPFGISQPQVGY